VYFRPALIAAGFTEEDVKRLVIWYDPSQVATRNDRAMDADSGFDRMAVSFETWRRAHGFSSADAPEAKEVAIRMLMEKGTLSPEMTQAMLAAIAPEVTQAATDAQQAQSAAPMPPEIQQILDQAAGAAPAAPEQPATPEGA
jgi:hypothetical protein